MMYSAKLSYQNLARFVKTWNEITFTRCCIVFAPVELGELRQLSSWGTLGSVPNSIPSSFRQRASSIDARP